MLARVDAIASHPGHLLTLCVPEIHPCRLCGMLVLVEDAAKAVLSADIKTGGGNRCGDRRRQSAQRLGVGDALVRPVRVIELLELPQRVEQVRLVPDQGAVEQFAAACLHPPFHDRIHSGYLDAAEHHFDPGVLEHGVEQCGELAVPVPDQEPRPAPAILKIHRQVTRGPSCRSSTPIW